MILVTGATGGIGRVLLDHLLTADREPVRVVARDPDKVPRAVRDRVEVVVGSHADPDVVDAALDGVRSVFWLVAGDPTAASPFHAYVGFSLAFAAALPGSGVERVVTVSALGRRVQGYAGHASASQAMDDLLRATGVHLRALVAPTLMDNLLRDVDGLRSDGVVRAAAQQDRRAPMVARSDVAAVAARLLLDGSWTGQEELPVLGPEDLSADDVDRVLAEVLGRPVRHGAPDPQQQLTALVTAGSSPRMARGLTAMLAAKARGLDDADRPTRAADTPTTLRQFAERVLAPAVQGR
ncbi:NAD-dependent epimerase/dehydratase family protein [Streptomyces sp. NP160]|uniref:NAD(P)H-binding protein n=1 Tax=Streptomyces sp. NP160 TaxID=2586637 RepID=UPI00111AD576|nr:NAD(P)H-binding protein [Streptomyces sp. NP160]TNM67356.1 NAD-dependent epimerase/dehydratase family protein [Streptomyces sp. NP160]